MPLEGLPAAHVEDTPDTPTIETLVDLANSRPELARPDRPWAAGDTLKNVVVKVTMPDGTIYEGVGLPADIELLNDPADVEAGRDEVLEAAIALIGSGSI